MKNDAPTYREEGIASHLETQLFEDSKVRGSKTSEVRDKGRKFQEIEVICYLELLRRLRYSKAQGEGTNCFACHLILRAIVLPLLCNGRLGRLPESYVQDLLRQFFVDELLKPTSKKGMGSKRKRELFTTPSEDNAMKEAAEHFSPPRSIQRLLQIR